MNSAKGNEPALHKAVIEGMTDVVQAMLAQGVDPNERDPETGRTTVHCAVQADSVAVLQELQHRGANMSAVDNTFNTPLYEAAESGKVRALVWLLDNVHDCKDCGVKEEALFLAAFNGHQEAVRSLLARGAPLECMNELGRTPLYQAAENGHHGVVKLFLERGANAKIRDCYGKTLLHAAAEGGDSAAVGLVMKLGVDVNGTDYGGNTPLHCSAPTNAEVVLLLLEHGADMEIRNREGHTALHKAALAKNTVVVNLLRERGACETHEMFKRLQLL